MAQALPKETPANTHHRIVLTKVFVRGLKLDALIGVYDHELGRTQPLVCDVELDVAVDGWTRLEDTLNYESIGEMAREIAAAGHIPLVETFAESMASAMLEDPRVTRARVRVEKPQALEPHAAAAGVEITLVKG